MLHISLIKTSLRDLRRRGWQLALMILGVALGVAVVVAIDLANQSAAEGFRLSTQAVVGKATYQIQGGPSGVSADVYRQVRVDLGVAASAPVVEGQAVAPDLDGRSLRLLGVDPLAEAPFRGLFDRSNATRESFAPFFTNPAGVLVGQSLAAAYQLGPGDGIQLVLDGRKVRVSMLGVLSGSGEGGRVCQRICWSWTLGRPRS